MNSILELFQPVISNVVLSVLAIVIAAAGLFLLRQWKALGAWINARKTAAEAQGAESLQNTLWSVAQEAYAKAEITAAELAGSDKMAVALDYAVKKLNHMGATFHTDEIRAKIHEAWLKLEGIPKREGQYKISEVEVSEIIMSEIEKLVQK